MARKTVFRILLLAVLAVFAIGAAGCGDTKSDAADEFIEQGFPDATDEQRACVDDVFDGLSDEVIDEFESVGNGDTAAADVSPEATQAAQDLAACVQ